MRTPNIQVLHGNCLDVLPTFADCSVDSIVTDPPYELGFMGKKWDASGIAYNVTLWQECLRVLKPGGHLLAFGGTRTYHRMACAIEDAGFEIRDSIHWLYGSGFPKSLDVSKAIDKAAGVEREVVGIRKLQGSARTLTGGNYGNGGNNVEAKDDYELTAPATDAAKQWEGWGTALKPAHEPIVVARKPLEGTVAGNVLAWGTGALNIDASRIGYQGDYRSPAKADGSLNSAGSFGAGIVDLFDDEAREALGRWPANVVFSHHEDCDLECVAGCPVAELDQQSGIRPSGAFPAKSNIPTGVHYEGGWGPVDNGERREFGSGGASRFFYCAKPSKRERNAGLDHLDERAAGSLNMKTDNHAEKNGQTTDPRQNHHPTVKPLALMRYLVRLVTPLDGTVLEPFAGSGTTLMACILENFNAIGIEMTDEYLPIIEGRVAWAYEEAAKQTESDQQELPL